MFLHSGQVLYRPLILPHKPQGLKPEERRLRQTASSQILRTEHWLFADFLKKVLFFLADLWTFRRQGSLDASRTTSLAGSTPSLELSETNLRGEERSHTPCSIPGQFRFPAVGRDDNVRMRTTASQRNEGLHLNKPTPPSSAYQFP